MSRGRETVSRRRLLQVGGAAIACGLAGCSDVLPGDTPWTVPPKRPPTVTPPSDDGEIRYVGPNGDDSNSGTSTRPLRSVSRALNRSRPGDSVRLLGGTYRSSGTVGARDVAGTNERPITLEAVAGEAPVFEFTDQSTGGLQFADCHWLIVRGLTVIGAPSRGLFITEGSSDMLVESVDVRDSGGDPNASGAGVFVLDSWSITLRDVVARNSYDPSSGGSNADGIAIERSPGNLVEDCVAAGNSDDGFDLWQTTETTLRRCWAFGNGSDPDGNPAGDGDGFKLGGGNVSGNNRIERCVAYGNRNRGFDDNTATRRLTVVHCTAFDNPINYRFGCRFQGTESTCVDHRLANNLSSDGQIHLSPLVDSRSNSWDLGLTDPGFISTDPDDDEFLRLSAASPAVDAGADIGLAYSGSAPDLGAFEREANETTGER